MYARTNMIVIKVFLWLCAFLRNFLWETPTLSHQSISLSFFYWFKSHFVLALSEVSATKRDENSSQLFYLPLVSHLIQSDFTQLFFSFSDSKAAISTHGVSRQITLIGKRLMSPRRNRMFQHKSNNVLEPRRCRRKIERWVQQKNETWSNYL